MQSRIRQLRTERGYSQQQLAEAIKSSQQSITDWRPARKFRGRTRLSPSPICSMCPLTTSSGRPTARTVSRAIPSATVRSSASQQKKAPSRSRLRASLVRRHSLFRKMLFQRIGKSLNDLSNLSFGKLSPKDSNTNLDVLSTVNYLRGQISAHDTPFRC